MNFQVSLRDTMTALPALDLPSNFSLTLSDQDELLCWDGMRMQVNLGNQQRPLFFDFLAYQKYWQQVRPVKSKDPLGRALGIQQDQTVMDLSCGTGKDSSLFLYWGLRVKAIERHPLVYLLLKDALRMALADPKWKEQFGGSFELYFGEATDFIGEKASAFYFDPMFGEEKKSSAKSRKEMEFFKQYVGGDLDAWNVVQKILTTNKRLILKRPLHEKIPVAQNCLVWKGKSIKYLRF